MDEGFQTGDGPLEPAHGRRRLLPPGFRRSLGIRGQVGTNHQPPAVFPGVELDDPSHVSKRRTRH